MTSQVIRVQFVSEIRKLKHGELLSEARETLCLKPSVLWIWTRAGVVIIDYQRVLNICGHTRLLQVNSDVKM